MNKPINPNVQIPPNFAVNGQKTDFTQQKIQNGFNQLEPDILAGDNLNKFIDDTYKSITYSNAGVADLYRSVIMYDAAETYYQNSIVFNVDSNNVVSIYLSKIDNNSGNSLSDNNYWEKIQLGNIRNIGEIVHSVVPLNDAGLHLLDGALISGSGSYSAFVDYIAGLYNDNPSASYFTTEANWQSTVTTYGVCGKFVYDSVNNTVRLPKITGIIEGTIDSNTLGDLVQAGLPVMTSSTAGSHKHTRGDMNIWGRMAITSGSYSDLFDESVQMSGAFSGTQTALYPDNHNTASTLNGYSIVDFNASNNWTGSTSLNGEHTHTVSWGANTNTVQPQTIKAFVYIVVATSVKTDIEVDIDNIATDLNGKADTDLSNVSSTGKISCADWGIPSAAVELTYNSTNHSSMNGTTFTNTTGYPCYLFVEAQSNNANCTIYAKNISAGVYTSSMGNSGIVINAYIPVANGQQCQFYVYVPSGSVTWTATLHKMRGGL